MAAGERHGIAPGRLPGASNRCGWRRATAPGAADITPNDNPFEAGLGWAVKLKSEKPFLGREPPRRAAGAPLSKRLMTFTVDDPAVVLAGRETILRDGVPVGYLTSGGWGYTVAANIGLGYVRNAEGSAMRSCSRGGTSSRSRPSGCRRRCTWARSTIQPTRG